MSKLILPAHLRISHLPNDDDRERPTQPNSEPPSGHEHEFGQLPRLPRLPSIKPDPNSWEHKQLAILVEAMSEIREARKSFDADALLSRQTEVFASIVTDRYEMIREQIVAYGTEVKKLGKRVDEHDDRFDTDEDRFEKIEFELATMKTQMDRLEQMRSHIEALETQLGKLREGQQQNATAESTAPGKQPAPASDP